MRKILKTDRTGLLFKPFGHQHKHYLAVSTQLFFRLGDQPELVTEALAWPALLPCLPPMQVLDEVMPKSQAEVLVAGKARTGGEPRTEMEVRLQCGSVDKTLRVTGPRDWRYGLFPLRQIDKPAPFTEMPLDWQHAWGGEHFPLNELGRGYTASAFPSLRGTNEGPMPTVQYPQDRIKPGRGKFQPAGFGAFPMSVQQRKKLAGNYNGDWLEHQFPGLAEDIDWRFFQMAPQDQWLPGYFTGEEHYQLEGMSDTSRVLNGGLPDWKPLLFAGTSSNPCQPVELKADTLWLLPEAGLGVWIWHGQIEVTEADAKDVTALMVALERPGQSRGIEHYQQVMALRTDPATARQHAFNDAQLIAPEHRESCVAPEAESAQPAEEQAQAMLDYFQQKYDLPPLPDIDPEEAEFANDPAPIEPDPVVLPGAEDFARGEVDLTDTLKGLEQLVDQMEAEAAEKFQQLEDVSAGSDDVAAQPPEASWQQIEPLLSPQQRVAAREAQLSSDDTDPQDREGLRLACLQLESDETASRVHQRDASKTLPDEDARVKLAQRVSTRLRRGESLQGYDLTGVQLNGVDFSGQNLDGVCFERAWLEGCNFSASSLQQACFTEARLQDCLFSDADLTESGWAQARLRDCSFVRARLVASQWYDSRLVQVDACYADLTQAAFQQCELAQCRLMETALSNSQWVSIQALNSSWARSEGEKLNWLNCQLFHCDISASRWLQSALLNCKTLQLNAEKLNWRKILVTGERSRWPQSCWQSATLNECGFRATDLSDSDWHQARLEGCDLGQAKFNQADLQQAVLLQCLLMEAQLQDSNLYKADLYGCRLNGADLSGADLTDGQGWGADFSHSRLIETVERDFWPPISAPGVVRMDRCA